MQQQPNAAEDNPFSALTPDDLKGATYTPDSQENPFAALRPEDLKGAVHIPEGGSGILRQAADIPVNVMAGTTAGLKGIADIFGADSPASQRFARNIKYWEDMLSPEAKADKQVIAAIMQEAQDKGIGAQVAAGLKAFSVAPIDTTANALGTMMPTIATGAAGKAAGLGAKGVQVAQGAMALGQGAGFTKGSIYDGTKNYLIEQGIAPEVAEKAASEAQRYGGENMLNILVGAGLNAATALMGVERITGKAIAGGVKDASKNVLTHTAKGIAQEGVPEFFQGGHEQMAQNLALVRQGYTEVPVMRGVVSQGTMEAAAGGLMAGPVSVADYYQTPDMVQRARQAAAAPASFVPTPEVDPALVAQEFGDVADSQQPANVDERRQERPAADDQAAAPIEQPSGPPITVEATRPAIAVHNRAQDDTGAVDENRTGASDGGDGQRANSDAGSDVQPSENQRRGSAGRLRNNQSSVKVGEPILVRMGAGSRKADAAGRDRIEAAKERLRAIVRDEGITGKQRADLIENGKRLIAFHEARAVGPQETFFINGDEAALTYEDAPEGFEAFIYLDGPKAGEQGVRRSPQAQAADVAAKQESWQQQQAAFRRLRESGRSDQMPQQPQSPPTAGDAAVSQEVQDLKAKLMQLDPLFAHPDFFPEFDKGGYHPEKVEKLRQMVVNFSKPKAAKAKRPKGKKAANPIAEALDKYEGSGEIETVQDLADELEGIAVETGNRELEDAVREYRVAREEHVRDYGMRDDDGGDAFVAKVKALALQPTPANSSPATGGESQQQPAAQTQQGAVEAKPEHIKSAAIRLPSGKVYKGVTHMEANEAAIEDHDGRLPEFESGFVTSQGRFVGRQEAMQIALASKQTTEAQDTFDKGDLHTGKLEFTENGKIKPPPRSVVKQRIKTNLKPNSGAVDLDIINDLVDYGKQFYRAGMTFGKWAGQMVKEFGQSVARYLRMAYDRIVQAYKDSPYSSEAGSVGDVGPKQKQESLNRRAKASDAISDEAKAAMGDGIYDVMPLYGEGNIMDQAIAEIERLGGLDAAAAKMIEIEKRPGGLEPIEMAMALHLTRQLDATNPVMAGNMVRIASTKGRSMGQANAAIKLFAEIDTATIDHYAQTLVEQEASSVSEDYARLIADAGKDLREAKAEFYKEKLRIIHASILELQTKGEKIITKIREAIPDNARRTKMLDDIRTILKGDIGRQEAIREVAKLMKDNGIPPTSAQAWSNSIVSNVFKLTNKSKAALARDMAKKHSWRVRSWKKLLGEVENGEISDTDFLANLTALSGFPHISRATGAKLKKWAAEYKTVKDQRLKEIIAFQIWEEIHSQVPPEIAMQLRAFAYLSMLSYPLTWVKNIGGNAILFGANTAKDALIGTVIDPAVAALRTGKRASVGYGNLGVRIKGLAEPVRVIRRGMKYEQEVNPNATTWERFRVGLRHLRLLSKMTSQNKWDISDAKEAGRRMFGDKFMFGVFGDKVKIPGVLRTWESGLSVALGGPDRAFWEAEFRASLAQREAAAKANGEWTGMHTYADMEAAFEDAARAIFQNANPISQGLGKIRGGLNWLSTLGLTEQFGLGTVLIAFTQVPGSILVRGAFDWSPLGWVANSAYQWFRPSIFRMTKGRFGGQFDQRKFNNAMAEGLLGTTGLVGAGFWLASMGILTASEDDDRDVADANKAQRIMPFSVNLSALGRVLAGDINKQQPQTGDFTVRYDWAQPLAIAVASGAEMAVQLERARIKGLTGIEAANSVKTVLTAGLKSLEEQPLVSGMASFARTWGFSGLYDALAMTALKAPSMFIPQLARRSAQYMDNTVRETRGGDFVTRPFQQIAASLPYLSSQYPARIDVTGKPMERFPDAGNTWYNLTINPIVTSRIRLDPVLQEATRLMNMTGERSQFPRQVGRTTEINGKKVELTNDQITRYNYYVGNMTMAMLQYRMGRAKYQRSSDDEKARLFAKDLADVAAVARVGVFGADRRKLSPDQRQILREFLKSPIAQSNPPTEATPPQ